MTFGGSTRSNITPVVQFHEIFVVEAKISWNQNSKTASTGSSINPIKYFAFPLLVLAFKINNVQGWKNTLAFYSGYTTSDLKDLVESLLIMLQQYPKENLKTVRQKYSHK